MPRSRSAPPARASGLAFPLTESLAVRGRHLPQVNSLEMEMLRMISFSLFVQPEQYERYRCSLYSHMTPGGAGAGEALAQVPEGAAAAAAAAQQAAVEQQAAAVVAAQQAAAAAQQQAQMAAAAGGAEQAMCFGPAEGASGAEPMVD